MLQEPFFKTHAACGSPFARPRVALLQGHQVAGSELRSSSNGVPAVSATILTVVGPPWLVTNVALHSPVFSSAQFPPPDPSPVAVVALDVAPILLQSWPVDVADPVLLQAIQDIQLHNLSCHSEPF